MEHETSGTTQALTYLALTLGLAIILKYLFTSRTPANIPPFPAKPYPLLGHLPYLAGDVKKLMAEWTKS